MKLKTKFQDEDFDLGEVVDASIMYGYDDKIEVYCTEKMKHRKYNSIKDFTDHWEDAPEGAKKYWFIDAYGNIVQNEITKHYGDEYTDMTDAYENQKQIGNYFDSREEAEKAVERLRAWKRLKDKGFRFDPVYRYEALCGNGFNIPITATMPPEAYTDTEVSKDLDICFGGEE